MANQVSDYSGSDRFLHKLAFSSSFVQKVLADLEDSMFKKEISIEASARPIFITSLPRAGTTALLTALASLPDLASHTYRDMPFVMAPLLWSKLSGSFQKGGEMKERAHGDGIEVGYDSPEAFEEVVWRAFWADKYTDAGIDLWEAEDRKGEAEEFFRKHVAKIVSLRCKNGAIKGRYISKNNANIGRLDLIPKMFPDATLLVPIRSPMEHAASLLRQHQNFLQQHQGDDFTKRYMHDIGHFEFGDLHRPILFPHLGERLEGLSAESLDYWLGYWIAAFKYVQARRNRLVLVSHEALCNNSQVTTEWLCGELGIDSQYQGVSVSSHFESPIRKERTYPVHSANLKFEAEALYEDLVGSL